MTVIITLAWKNANNISEKVVDTDIQTGENSAEIIAVESNSGPNQYQNSVEQGLKIARRVIWTSGVITKLRKNRYHVPPAKVRFLEKMQRKQRIYRNQRLRNKAVYRNNQA